MLKSTIEVVAVNTAMNQEQWILAGVVSASINALNTPFCSKDGKRESVNADPDYIEKVAKGIAIRTSKMALEDAITVLQKALECFRGYGGP